MDLMTPEENDEFNRIERESASVRQEAIKDSLWRKRQTMNDIALLTQIVRDMSARITQLEKGMQLDPLPTTSPRTWVGLTEEEREQVINSNTTTGLWHMAKAIESLLKDKNT